MRLMPSSFACLVGSGARGSQVGSPVQGSPGAGSSRLAAQTAALLPEGRLRRIDAERGTSVQCITGRLWITFAGDAVDHVLNPGARFVSPGPGLMLIEALGTSTYVLEDSATMMAQRAARN